mgnify:CR=1 FL=1
MDPINTLTSALKLSYLAFNMLDAYRHNSCIVEIHCPGCGKVIAACDYAIKHTNETMKACSISRTLGVQATAARINTSRTLKWI